MTSESNDQIPTPAYHAIVCDDDADVCSVAKAFLESGGIKVDVTNFGEDALERISRTNYDVMMLDIMMPGMTGIEVLQKIRSGIPNSRHLPIILVSAVSEEDLMLTGLNEGATDFLKKPFSPAELLARMCTHAASKRMHDKLITVNRTLEAEREKIFQIQQGLLPEALPKSDKLTFSAAYRPSSRAGGDFYDAFYLRDGRLLIAMGDVSGHGIPSAMHMSILRAVLHSEADFDHSIEEILSRLNRVLYYGLDGWSFVTFYLAVYDESKGILRHCGAGHPPPLLHRLDTGEITELALEPALPLGIEVDFQTQATNHSLDENQRLLIYTDGMVEETHSETGELFGRARLYEALQDLKETPSADVPARLLKALEGFSTRELPRDDVTLLLMELHG